ncbi:hypothetical protein NC653_026973 [Populus alba x Populus x berolinensis]|uniref:Importin N-terminal domain-containing protein n=1 Tax=Populus alba x Populus x berolinensis TaxID=444605 RepID=A0AAD6Q467_9ROSI|nr:hypothetical protein NC653_026973 [Populus alba x Populus x berolinensis]
MGGIYRMCGVLDKIGFLIIQNDGFELDKKVVVIADTSRKQDHDPAATSLFDSMITFCLPVRRNHQEIATHYPEIHSLAEVSLRQASTQPGFGAALSKVAANKELPFGLRQLAALLLKQFIKKHWHESEESFEPPAVVTEEKGVIRRLLLPSLDDSHRKFILQLAWPLL